MGFTVKRCLLAVLALMLVLGVVYVPPMLSVSDSSNDSRSLSTPDATKSAEPPKPPTEAELFEKSSLVSEPVRDTTQQPYQAVVHLDVLTTRKDPKTGYPIRQHCTGALIAPQAVLTAAHCLKGPYPTPWHAVEVEVTPAAKGRQEPFLSAVSKQYEVSKTGKDVGVIYLGSSFEAPGALEESASEAPAPKTPTPIEVAEFPSNLDTHETLYSASYPCAGDLTSTCQEEDGYVYSKDNRVMWKRKFQGFRIQTGSQDAYTVNELKSAESGSLLTRKVNGKAIGIGVAVRQYSEWAFFVPFNDAILAEIKSWKSKSKSFSTQP